MTSWLRAIEGANVTCSIQQLDLVRDTFASGDLSILPGLLEWVVPFVSYRGRQIHASLAPWNFAAQHCAI
jgi:hypothetical protein